MKNQSNISQSSCINLKIETPKKKQDAADSPKKSNIKINNSEPKPDINSKAKLEVPKAEPIFQIN